MDDGKRQQYRNGYRRFKTRPVKVEEHLAKIDGRSVPVFRYTVDLFEDPYDPDLFVSYSVQQMHLNIFFEFLQIPLN